MNGEKLPPKWAEVVTRAEVNIDLILKDGDVEIPTKIQEAMYKHDLSRLELGAVSRILAKIRKNVDAIDVTVANASSYYTALEAIRHYNGGLKKSTKSVKSVVNEIGSSNIHFISTSLNYHVFAIFHPTHQITFYLLQMSWFRV